jgi:AAA domain/RepB DNA-primase from phage plasmid
MSNGAANFEVVQPILRPKADLMLAHVDHLFGGYLDGYQDGLIELAWTDTVPDQDGKYRLRHARLFGTDQLYELVEEAARLNSQPMCNVYIGAALRKPETAPFERASDDDAYVLTAAYVDLDDPGTANAAKNIYGKAKPTMIVVTGRAPHTRAQMWWRLDEPLTDTKQWPALLKGMAAAMKGDGTVTNPARVMRLAGSVAWPVKEGRSVEVTDIVPLKERGQNVYAHGHLAGLFPPIATIGLPQQVTRRTNSLGLETKIIDGREHYMTRTIAACLIEYIGASGRAPSAQELFDTAWPQYERNVDLTRPGRGPDEFMGKCTYTVDRFHRGDIRGAETVDRAIEVYRAKAQARSMSATLNEPAKPLLVSSGEFAAGLAPPDYAIDGLVQRRYLYSLTANTGHGKTAIALLLALLKALGLPLAGREIDKGVVLYFAGENPDDVRARWIALCERMGVEPDAVEVYFMAGTGKLSEIGTRVEREVKSLRRDVALVIIDTSIAYFDGDDENNNVQAVRHAKQMRNLISLPGGPCVIALCHPVKKAMRDDLLPRGGGAFLNEVDGNLTCWNDDGVLTLHTLGKFRGPDFAPIKFQLETVTSERIKDSKGRLMPTVLAKALSKHEERAAEAGRDSDEDALLLAIAANERASLAGLATFLGWVSDKGENTSKVSRRAEGLKRDKLVQSDRKGTLSLTDKGKKEVQRIRLNRELAGSKY